MGRINILDFEIANLIAAGEVVERPSSVMKELIENSIDSGATEIVAEIKRGGVALIRVSDNGCGIEKDDLPVSLKRHATSKIRTRDDLDGIVTLGFRGEALAAISSVSVMTIITKTKEASVGSMLIAEGGTVTDMSDVGAADGTTVVVENLFYNVPARRKFLKKDSTEAMNVSALVEKVALSRPDISIQLLIDGTERFKTPGNGKLLDTIYAVFGKEFSGKLIAANGVANGITVSGYIGRSDNTRKNRNLQNVFINGRYVKSLTAMAAIEKAYTSYIAPEAFPVCVLFLDMNPSTVDVNVHPAKLEVKFANEQPVFEAVYYTVKRALEEHEYRPEMQLASGRKNDRNPLGAFVPIGADTKGKQISLGDSSIKGTSFAQPEEYRGNRIDLSKYGIDINSPIKMRSAAGESLRPSTQHEAARGDAQRENKETPYTIQHSTSDTPRSRSSKIDGSSTELSPKESLEVLERLSSAESDLSYGIPQPQNLGSYTREEERVEPQNLVSDTFGEKEQPQDPASYAFGEGREQSCGKGAYSTNTEREGAAINRQNSLGVPSSESYEKQGVDTSEYRIIGEAFNCYVMVEYHDELLIIDKHAAHERIIFEDLKRDRENDGRVASQELLLPLTVLLTSDELAAADEYRETFESVGFSIEVCQGSVNIKAIPSMVSTKNAEALLQEMLDDIIRGTGDPEFNEKLRRERALYQVACKAAIKGGRVYDRSIIEWLVGRVLALPDITVCPHGRPIAYKLTKAMLDKQFDRIK